MSSRPSSPSAPAEIAAASVPRPTPRANVPSLTALLRSPLQPSRALRRVARAAAGLVAAAFLFGLVRFLAADGIATATLPRRNLPLAEEHNLADFRYGPTVRVSSYNRDPISQHHPLFLVDGRTAPTLLEKWVSAGADRAPWVEITWREPRQLERVVVRHAGEYEGAVLTLHDYDLTCIGGAQPVTLKITDNQAPVAVHAFHCPGARGLRLDAHIKDSELVRLYEIEAWGR